MFLARCEGKKNTRRRPRAFLAERQGGVAACVHVDEARVCARGEEGGGARPAVVDHQLGVWPPTPNEFRYLLITQSFPARFRTIESSKDSHGSWLSRTLSIVTKPRHQSQPRSNTNGIENRGLSLGTLLAASERRNSRRLPRANARARKSSDTPPAAARAMYHWSALSLSLSLSPTTHGARARTKQQKTRVSHHKGLSQNTENHRVTLAADAHAAADGPCGG